MKNLFLILFVFVSFSGKTQFKEISNNAILTPYVVEVSHNLTTTIIFPKEIVSVDRGSSGLLAKKVDQVTNILKIKAENEAFESTNLTIITEDGKVYSFYVEYNPDTFQYVIDFTDPSKVEQKAKFNKPGMDSDELLKAATKVLRSNNKTVAKETADNVTFTLNQIFVKNDIMYFPLRIKNDGEFSYDIDFIKFLVLDKKQRKRTAQQTLELEPLTVFFAEEDNVPAGQTKTLVYAFDKFTINKDKKLQVSLFEENGGRNVMTEIKYGDINRAKYLRN